MREVEVDDEETLERSKGRTIKGLYLISNRNQTHLSDRDHNATVNMAQILRSLLDFKKIPWEFRRDTELRNYDAYMSSRKYSYIAKFKRKRKKGSGQTN